MTGNQILVGAALVVVLVVWGPARGAVRALIYTVARLILVAATLLTLLTLAVLAAGKGLPGILVFAALLSFAFRKRYAPHLTTLGSARWARPADIAHLLDAPSGLIVGVMNAGRQSIKDAILALLHPGVRSEDACRAFLNAISFKTLTPAVRLVDACHIAVFCPPGGGKTSALVIPYILNLP